MAQPKGKTGNPAGRPKGSPNKVTTDLRASIKAFLDQNWPKVQQTFDELEPKDRLVFIDKMMGYSLPKLQAVAMDVSTDLNKLDDQQLTALFLKISNGQAQGND